jgi:hypothetical protein
MGDGVMAAIEYVRNVPGNTQACGVQGSPKYSIKAVVLIWVNCPALLVIIGDGPHQKGKVRKMMNG